LDQRRGSGRADLTVSDLPAIYGHGLNDAERAKTRVSRGTGRYLQRSVPRGLLAMNVHIRELAQAAGVGAPTVLQP
jgi:hypothetical protein